jgi:hypothetical protein
VPSPILIGRMSDWTGKLETALLLCTVAMGLSGVLYLLGARTLGRDLAVVLETVRRRESEATR